MRRLRPSLPYPNSSSSLFSFLFPFATLGGHDMDKMAINNPNIGQKPEEEDPKNIDKGKEQEIEMEKMVEEKIGLPPEKPLPGDCCGSGCQICVWDTYYNDLELYNTKRDAFLKSLSQSQSAKP